MAWGKSAEDKAREKAAKDRANAIKHAQSMKKINDDMVRRARKLPKTGMGRGW